MDIFQYFHFYLYTMSFSAISQELTMGTGNQHDSSESHDNDKFEGDVDKREGDGEKETFIMGGN